jgi:magnesium-transporting ATPase (P-type)
LASFALERDKNNWYRVTRNRQIIEVQEHDLVVGDIL